jgi:hypothetical protein
MRHPQAGEAPESSALIRAYIGGSVKCRGWLTAAAQQARGTHEIWAEQEEDLHAGQLMSDTTPSTQRRVSADPRELRDPSTRRRNSDSLWLTRIMRSLNCATGQPLIGF